LRRRGFRRFWRSPTTSQSAPDKHPVRTTFDEDPRLVEVADAAFQRARCDPAKTVDLDRRATAPVIEAAPFSEREAQV